MEKLEILEVLEQAALNNLHQALKGNAEFWAKWIHLRTSGPNGMIEFFAPDPEERKAAKDLSEALLAFNELQKLKDKED